MLHLTRHQFATPELQWMSMDAFTCLKFSSKCGLWKTSTIDWLSSRIQALGIVLLFARNDNSSLLSSPQDPSSLFTDVPMLRWFTPVSAIVVDVLNGLPGAVSTVGLIA